MKQIVKKFESTVVSVSVFFLLFYLTGISAFVSTAQAATKTQSIIFVEDNLSEYQSLVGSIKQGIEVHVLDYNKNGLEQMSEILNGRSGIDAIYLLSHGAEGQINLGAKTLTNADISKYTDLLAQIGSTLKKDGDILIYGCNVAKGEDGMMLIDKLSQATGADVAASDNLTGDSDQGGDWVLESSIGEINASPLVFKYKHVLVDEFTRVSDPFPDLQYDLRIAFGDFDNDGDIDALSQNGNTIGQGYIYTRANGDGTYTNFNQSGTSIPNSPFANADLTGLNGLGGFYVASVIPIDYDNDGDTDIISRSGSVAGGSNFILRNDNGSFTRVADPFPDLTYDVRIEFADFDNDGDIDALAQQGNTIGQGYIYVRRNSDGTYTQFNQSGTSIPSTPFAATDLTGMNGLSFFAVDYDNDGDKDIINRSGSVAGGSNYILRNDSGTTFTKVADPFGDTQYDLRMTFGDFDSDGDVDALQQESNVLGQGYFYMQRNSDGSYTRFDQSGMSIPGSPFSNVDLTDMNGINFFTVDYDSDGDLDVISRSNSIAGGANFVLKASGSPPILVSSTPSDNSIDVAVNTNITLNLSENVTAGDGNIYIRKTSDKSIVETIAANSSKVAINGSTVTINPDTNLENNTSYYLTFDLNAFLDSDLKGFGYLNEFVRAGFDNINLLNFITASVTQIEITAFDHIGDVVAGTVGNTTYANASAVIAALPVSVSANTNAVTVPVITWVDTDGYNPAVAGSYTFTATLGAIPGGFANSGNHTATVEVIVQELAPSITTNPNNSTITEGTGTSFTVVAGGTGLTYQWKVDKNDGNGFVDLTNSASYNGATTDTLTITNATTGMSGYKYKVEVSGTIGSPATSNEAVLTVTEVPAVNSVAVDPTTASIVQGENKQLTKTVIAVGGAAETVTWSSSDVSGKVTVDETGLVTVASDAAPGDYIITATSTFDTSKKGTATITVSAAPVVPAVNSVAVDPTTASIVQGENKQLTKTVIAVGGAAETATWSSSDVSGKVTVDETGLVTVASDAAPGDYTITATSTFDTSKKGTATITVTAALVVPTVNSVAVDPTTASIVQGENKQLTKTVIAVGGAAETVTWSSSDVSGKVTVDETGLVTVASDAAPGDYIITATSTFDTSKTGTATITVTAAPVVPAVNSVAVDPTTASIVQGENKQLTKTVIAVGGAAETVTWSSSDASGKVTVDSNGLVTVASDAAPGDYTITATSTFDTSKTGTATITVTAAPVAPAVNSVAVDPTTASIVQGENKQLTKTVIAVGEAAETVTWSSSDVSGKVTVDETGLVTVASDAAPGDYTITATSTFDTSKKGTATITVSAAPVVPAVNSVAVDPTTASIVQGENKQLTKTVIAVGGAAETVTWSSSDVSGKVTVDETGLVTVASDAAPGDYTITATSTFDTSKKGTATITVSAAPVVPAVNSVAVDPTTASIVQGENKQLTKTVIAVGGAAETVTWSSSDASGKVTVDETGLVIVASDATPGDYTITATSTFDTSKKGTATITVTAAPVAPAVNSVAVDPTTASIVQGENKQLTKTVIAVGGAAEIVMWSSSDASGKVTVDETGLVTVASDAAPGDYTITATSTFDSSKKGTATITVTAAPVAPAVNSVAVDPTTASIVQGENKQFTKTVIAVGGAAETVTWSSSDVSGKVTVDETGLVTVASDAAPGDYTITATSTFDTSKKGTATITVSAAPVVPAVNSVAVDPTTASIVQGENKQLTKTVIAVGGAAETATWSSSDVSGKVTVDETGLVTVASDAAPGDYTITATSTFDTSKKGTATITVTAAPVVPTVNSVAVDPTTASIVQGENKQLTKTVIAVGGAAETVTWSSSDVSGKVTVDETGLVTVASDAAPGDYTITATSTFDSSKKGTATITVTAAPVVPAVNSVAVDPTTASIVQGENKQLTKTVIAVGGAAETVTWSSSDASGKVTVDETGLVTVASDAAPGDYTITATSTFDTSKTGTATITVTAAPVAPAVNSVAVDPTTASIVQGENKQLTKTVIAVGGAAETVTWSSSDVSGKVTVDETGLVTVASDAAPGDYTITATSTFDTSKKGTATITVTAAPVAPAVNSVAVDPTTASIVQGENKQLTKTVIAVGGAAEIVMWSSSDASGKVTVDETGLVTVASDAALGDYTITATSTFDTSKKWTATITVSAAPVVPAVNSVAVDPTTASIVQGENKQLTKTVIAVGGAAETVTWSSSDASGKVTVDETGLVTVASDAAPGDYTITATSTFDTSKTGTATITVTAAPVAPAVNSVAVDPTTASIVQGENKQLTKTVIAVGGAAETVTWSSSDVSGKVTVDETGLVTVASDAAPGDYTITATSTFDSSKKGTATITVSAAPVVPAVNSVAVDPTTASIVQGENKQLTKTVIAVGGAAETVTWSSSDASGKVTVDSNGLVTVASDATPGDYTITATSTFDTSKKGTATITVMTSAAVTYTINYTAEVGGTIEGDLSQTVDEGSDGTTVTAVPDTGYHFVNWSDGKTNASRMDTNVHDDISVSAEFEIDLPNDTDTTTPAAVRISGNQKVDNTLEALLIDENGLSVTTSSAVTYKWYRISGNDADNGTLVGEGLTYKLISSDIGKYIKLVVSYIDKTFEKITSKISGNSSSGSSGSSGHSSSSTSSSNTSSTEKITVKVTDGKSDTSISKTVIERTTASDGTKKDIVTYTPDKAKETVGALTSEGKDTARIVATDTDNDVSETKVNIPKETLTALSSGNVNLQIETGGAIVSLPKESVQGLAQSGQLNGDLYFRLVPIKDETKQTEIKTTANQQATIKAVSGNNGVQVLGTPMTIETNMSQRAVDIVLPLKGITLPTDATERQAFLNDLGVFIEHSDGEKVLEKGEVVEYGDGIFGIKFTVNKFSDFTIVKLNKTNQTGWKLDNGYWYFFDNAGTMITGWYKSGSGDWVYDGKDTVGQWFHLERDGRMDTGWFKDSDGTWYFLCDGRNYGALGYMETGWKFIDGKWYFLKSNGAMATGWTYVDGSWYYLYSDGSMAGNTEIDGYRLDTSGAWINN